MAPATIAKGVPSCHVSVTLLQPPTSATVSVMPAAGTVVKRMTHMAVPPPCWQTMIVCADAEHVLGLASGPSQPERNCTSDPCGAATVSSLPVKVTVVT